MVKHFGVFKFHKTVSEDQIEACFQGMKGMVGKIHGLIDMEYGPYDSSEGLNEDFTHGFIMSFDSLASRDNYLPHPIHDEVREFVMPHLERVIVFDINI